MQKNMRLLLASFFLSTIASAITIETHKERMISGQLASADYTPTGTLDTGTASSASFQCTWASLTGTLDGQFLVQVSNNAGANWTSKSGATITVAGATGDEMISLNGVITEDKYRIKWVHNNVSGGTVNCYAVLKG